MSNSLTKLIQTCWFHTKQEDDFAPQVQGGEKEHSFLESWKEKL